MELTAASLSSLAKSTLGRGKAPQGFLFDLDGVLVPTARVHMTAWQELFDEVFAAHGWGPAYTDADYYAHVDGRSRYDGVLDVLASRGVDLPWGDPDDSPDRNTVCGLANRKNVAFMEKLASGVAPYPGTAEVLGRIKAQGRKTAVVSSSRNAHDVLSRAGLLDYFDVVVDGRMAEERTLPGKPAPDTFWHAAMAVGLDPSQCAVIEDALAGVSAGRMGGFGTVVGVDRGAGAAALAGAGADVVISSLDELMKAVGCE